MAIVTSSWYDAATGQDLGGGSSSWSGLGNMGSSNNTYTTTTAPAVSAANHLYIPFTGISLPSGSTLQGIEASLEGNVTGDTPLVDYFYLTNDGTSTGDGDTPSLAWSGTDTTTTYGGASDLWNSGYTKTDVEAAGFGLIVFVYGGITSSSTFSIDHVRIRFTYDDGVTASNPPNGLMLMGVGV